MPSVIVATALAVVAMADAVVVVAATAAAMAAAIAVAIVATAVATAAIVAIVAIVATAAAMAAAAVAIAAAVVMRRKPRSRLPSWKSKLRFKRSNLNELIRQLANAKLWPGAPPVSAGQRHRTLERSGSTKESDLSFCAVGIESEWSHRLSQMKHGCENICVSSVASLRPRFPLHPSGRAEIPAVLLSSGARLRRQCRLQRATQRQWN